MRSAVTTSRRRFSQEFKDELCQEVISTSKSIKDVAVAYGVGPETLRNWLNKYREANGGTEDELTLTERARLKVLERENAELRAEASFLKKQRLTSPGSSDSEQVRVHRLLQERRFPNESGGQYVCLVGGVDIGVLSLAGPATVSHGGIRKSIKSAVRNHRSSPG